MFIFPPLFFAMMLPEDLLSQKCVAFVYMVRLLVNKIEQIYSNICNTVALK